MNEDVVRFYTSDISLASYLYAIGFIPLELDRSNPERVEFVFAHSTVSELDIDTYVEKYQQGDCMCNARTLLNAYHTLKKRVFEDNNNNKKRRR